MNIRNTSKTALHLSALNGHRDVVRLLLDNDADVAAVDDNGDTPLHYAAYRYHPRDDDDDGDDVMVVMIRMMILVDIIVTVMMLMMVMMHLLNTVFSIINTFAVVVPSLTCCHTCDGLCGCHLHESVSVW